MPKTKQSDLRSVFIGSGKDDDPTLDLTFAEQLSAVRAIAEDRIAKHGVNPPYAYEVRQYLDITDEMPKDFYQYEVEYFCFVLGFAMGQMASRFGNRGAR